MNGSIPGNGEGILRFRSEVNTAANAFHYITSRPIPPRRKAVRHGNRLAQVESNGGAIEVG